MNYRGLQLGGGKLGVNLAGNFTLKNEIIGSPSDPAPIRAGGSTILNAQIRSLLTESRPRYKSILGFDFNRGKLSASLNNALFGPKAFQDLDNGGSAMNNIKQEFKPAGVTDLMLSYDLSKKATLSLGVNNLFNILPKWELVALNGEGEGVLSNASEKSLLEGFLSFSGRYRILGYNGSQFSQLGTMLNANLSIRI